MIHYVHSVPGRLRVRITHLKNNPREGDRLKAAFAGRPGTLSVEINERTGGAVIRFDHRQVTSGAILDYLEELGYWRNGRILAAEVRPIGPAPGIVNGAGSKIASAVVEKVIERSLVALIAAVV